MDYNQRVSEWLQTCKPARHTSFNSEMDTDVDVVPSKQGTSQGQIHLLPSSSVSTLKTNCKRGRCAQPTVAVQFFRANPAFMEPQKILQLITRYSTREILSWTNEGVARPVLTESQLTDISGMAITQVAQHIDNGEEMLRNSVEFARQHNRLHCFRMLMHSLQQRRIGLNLVSKDIHPWYGHISHAVESDDTLSRSKAYPTYAIPSLGSIPGELLYDPFFTYRSLQKIPDRILLEHCISHSYEHVSEKINLNNPSPHVDPQDIIVQVEKALRDPAVWDIATATT